MYQLSRLKPTPERPDTMRRFRILQLSAQVGEGVQWSDGRVSAVLELGSGLVPALGFDDVYGMIDAFEGEFSVEWLDAPEERRAQLSA